MIKRHKKISVALVALVAAIVVGVAFAYYSASGSATSNSQGLGHAPRGVTVTATLDSAGPLYPGDAADLLVSVTNTGNGSVYVGGAQVDSVTTSAAGCLPEWFVASPLSRIDARLGSGQSDEASGSVAFVDEDTLQDACSDATITAHVVLTP